MQKLKVQFQKLKSITPKKVDNSYDFSVENVHRIIAKDKRSKNAFYTSNCSHPDIEEFVKIKQQPGKLTKFNLSVAITNDFMECVINDSFWDLKWEGKTIKRVKAKDLYDLIMKSTYNRAEPGVIFVDNISENNPIEYLGKCNATNPCLVGDTLIDTTKGKMTIRSIIEEIREGNDINVLTFNINNNKFEFEKVTFGDKTRDNTNVIELELEDGTSVTLTPDHKVYTKNRGYVNASELTEDDILIKI
ncbi:MAG: hypothetical protein WC260_01670 [Candidatus Pacearchaeota archaeon]